MQSNKIFFRGSFWFWEKPMVNKVNITIIYRVFIFTPNPGEMIQFDEHIFQMGLVQPPTSKLNN